MAILEEARQAKSRLLALINTLGHMIAEIEEIERWAMEQVPQLKPRPFSQRDPRWTARQLGGSDKTIGTHGCLITCIASMLCDIGYETNPDTVNSWLTLNGGYASGNLFVFASIEKLGAKLVDLIDYPAGYPTDAEISGLRQQIVNGAYVIAKIDMDVVTRAVDEHWVRLLSIDTDGKNADIMDPWPMPERGNLIKLCPAYGKDVKYALWRVAIYNASGA